MMGCQHLAFGEWGLGKTALATHIHDKLLEEANGDIKVIWVTVSQNIDIHELQKVRAKSIKLDISNEPRKRIARKLFQAFKEMKKCVVVLDDVWDHFSLKDVGFPMSDNRIKLILTTRIREVCQGMGCEEVIKVEPLDERDSWALFDEFLGLSREELSLEEKNIAWDVVHECEGFPLSIVRIATSMKAETETGEWRHMLECLENLGNGQYEMDKWVFPVLRSSYDFLTNKLQRFFLYCILSTNGNFDNDDADHLIRRFVYESIDERKKLRVQYNEGCNMLHKLKNHSMLDHDDDGGGGYWMINKFLRVLAIGIGEENGKIMRKAYEKLTEIPSDDQWKEDVQKVFLTRNNIQTIPDGTCPKCSQLSTLLLDGNMTLNHISDEFFKHMPALKTLDLSGPGIKRLPESVSNLKCLIALLISRCRELTHIPSLRKLKQLISLDLSFTAITKAPMGLESLVNLRCLNLLPTDKLEMVVVLISKLINLECLKVGWAQCLMDASGQDTQSLEKLEFIEAHFRDISKFNTFMCFLARNCVTRSYWLTLQDGSDLHPIHDLSNARDIIKDPIKRMAIENMVLGNEKVIVPVDIKTLCITNCQQETGARSLCSVLSYGHNNNPHQIQQLQIMDCEDFEYLCCSSCPLCSSSQHVRFLLLCRLRCLKDLMSPYADSLHQSTLFSHLTHLVVSGCNSMEALMTPKLLAHQQNLCSIRVSYCWKMKEMVGAEEDNSGSGLLMVLLCNHLPHLTIELPMLTVLELDNMPQLDFVYRGIMLCPSLKRFSANQCERLNHPHIANSNNESALLMEMTPHGCYWVK